MGKWRGWICLWPGLPFLWLRGVFWGLAIAVLFALVLNLTLVVTFVWFETIAPASRDLLWITLGVGWTVSSATSWWWVGRQISPQDSGQVDNWFRAAQQEYLRGNWIDAELKLLKILGRNAGDADARLLLVSLYRRTRRLAEAEAELHHLERLESAVKWHWEIAQEQRLIANALSQQTPVLISDPNPSPSEADQQQEFQPQPQSKAA